MFMKRTSEANMRIKHSWDLNAQLYNRDLHKRKEIRKGELVLIWYMPRTNIEPGLHKKLILPGKGPYKLTKVFKESKTVKVELFQNLQITVNLKNVKRYFSRPKWMKYDHEESMDKEKPQIPSETVDHTDKEEEPVMTTGQFH
jgi:hypothetical protein